MCKPYFSCYVNCAVLDSKIHHSVFCVLIGKYCNTLLQENVMHGNNKMHHSVLFCKYSNALLPGNCIVMIHLNDTNAMQKLICVYCCGLYRNIEQKKNRSVLLHNSVVPSTWFCEGQCYGSLDSCVLSFSSHPDDVKSMPSLYDVILTHDIISKAYWQSLKCGRIFCFIS